MIRHTNTKPVEDMTAEELNCLMKSGFLRWRDPLNPKDSADLEAELMEAKNRSAKSKT